jgi:hypothetical protein
MIRAVISRLRGDDTRAIGREVAELRDVVIEIRSMTAELHQVVMSLNHEVHAGAPTGLPLFVGFADRLRTDAETAVGAAETIDRQLRRLEARLSPTMPTADA